MSKTYESLQELSGHESGAVQYSDGSIWIGNWVGIAGIPRLFAADMIEPSETLTAVRCKVPNEVKYIMNEYERDQKMKISNKGFTAWKVNGGKVIVITQSDWV